MSFPLRLAPFPVINTTDVITFEGKIATSRDACEGKILVVNGCREEMLNLAFDAANNGVEDCGYGIEFYNLSKH